MRNTRLYELQPVFFGICARYGEMDVGPNDEETVEHINQSGRMGDDVIGQGVGVRAGQFIDHPVHTEEFGKFGATQLQRGGHKNTQGKEAEGHEPGGAHQHRQPPPGHRRVVLQGPTDGQISVVGHDGQDGHLTANVGVHDESLQQAALVRDFMGGGQEIEEESRVEARSSVKAVDAKAAQEDVHGLVHIFIEDDDHDEADVDEEDHTVVEESDGEDGDPGVQGLVYPRESESPESRGVVHRQSCVGMVDGDVCA